MSKLCLGLATAFFLTAISFSGCCAPMGPIGPGCASVGCNDCSGCGTTTQYIANGPLDALRNARRRISCGAGCGETYRGEWISTPPDSYDPCCGDQFVGGATKCQPFCVQPGMLLRGLYGKRMCSGDASSTPCGCGDSLCGGGCGTIVGGGMMAAPAASSSCGCSTCASSAQMTTTQIVTSKPAVDRATAVAQRTNWSTQPQQSRRVVR